jgi:hypothetical protein
MTVLAALTMSVGLGACAARDGSAGTAVATSAVPLTAPAVSVVSDTEPGASTSTEPDTTAVPDMSSTTVADTAVATTAAPARTTASSTPPRNTVAPATSTPVRTPSTTAPRTTVPPTTNAPVRTTTPPAPARTAVVDNGVVDINGNVRSATEVVENCGSMRTYTFTMWVRYDNGETARYPYSVTPNPNAVPMTGWRFDPYGLPLAHRIIAEFDPELTYMRCTSY